MAFVFGRCYKRAVIEFLVAKKGWETFTNGCVLCMEVVQSTGATLDWFRVKATGSAETNLHDRPRSGRPATTTCPDMLQGADGIIHADQRITSRQLAVQLTVSNGSAMTNIDALGYSKVCARWVP